MQRDVAADVKDRIGGVDLPAGSFSDLAWIDAIVGDGEKVSRGRFTAFVYAIDHSKIPDAYTGIASRYPYVVAFRDDTYFWKYYVTSKPSEEVVSSIKEILDGIGKSKWPKKKK